MNRSAYDLVLERVKPGAELRTPDKSSGKPFQIADVDGRVKVSLFTFDSALKYLEDLGARGDNWLPVKDEMFQAVLNMENDRVRASSYVIAILGAANLIDIDGRRPNRVRLRD